MSSSLGAPHKTIIQIANGTHNTNYDAYFEPICKFIAQFVANPSSSPEVSRIEAEDEHHIE